VLGRVFRCAFRPVLRNQKVQEPTDRFAKRTLGETARSEKCSEVHVARETVPYGGRYGRLEVGFPRAGARTCVRDEERRGIIKTKSAVEDSVSVIAPTRRADCSCARRHGLPMRLAMDQMNTVIPESNWRAMPRTAYARGGMFAGSA